MKGLYDRLVPGNGVGLPATGDGELYKVAVVGEMLSGKRLRSHDTSRAYVRSPYNTPQRCRRPMAFQPLST